MNPLLHFSTSERRGILVLIFLIIIAVLTPSVYNAFIASNVEPTDTLLISEVKLIQSTFEKPEKPKNSENFIRKKLNLRAFDPNNEPLDSMLAMGINAKIAKYIDNYRSKKGSFRTKEDLKKLYGMNDSIYRLYEGFIIINSTKPTIKAENSNRYSTKISTKELKVIEINSADSSSLLDLKGIGPVFASRIIKYRNKLGGFYSKDQLKEVYGFDTTIFTELSRFIIIDTTQIKKLDLNLSTFKELNAHPYLEYDEVKSIFQYKNKKKSMITISELFENKIISKIKEEKIRIYIK